MNGNDANNRPETGFMEVFNTTPSALVFANAPTGNFAPIANSPGRNIGTALTTVKTAVSNSTTVTVDRATFFFDGYCSGSECLGTRDWIRVGNSAPVQVINANATTNVLTLSAAVTAAVNGPVSLAIHPVQGITLSGHTPDVGAIAYAAAVSSPVANFACAPLNGRKPLPVICTDASTNTPTSWAWTFGDTGTSTLQNPSRTYQNSGTYTVALTASNSAGSNTKTQAAYVKVSQTIFTTQVPVSPNATDGVPYELGLRLRASKAGKITVIRYYKVASDTGTHTGRIWSIAGTQLASVVFSGETASGWQEQALAIPLNITANTTYVVSTNVGSYFPINVQGLATSIVNDSLFSVAPKLTVKKVFLVARVHFRTTPTKIQTIFGTLFFFLTKLLRGVINIVL